MKSLAKASRINAVTQVIQNKNNGLHDCPVSEPVIIHRASYPVCLGNALSGYRHMGINIMLLIHPLMLTFGIPFTINIATR